MFFLLAILPELLLALLREDLAGLRLLETLTGLLLIDFLATFLGGLGLTLRLGRDAGLLLIVL